MLKITESLELKKKGGGGVFEYTGFAWDLIISLHYKQINT